MLQGFELLLGEKGPIGAAHRVQPVLDEVHSHEHPEDGPAGVEALCKVQTAGGGLLGPHREYVGIAGSLKEGQAAGQDKIGYQEGIV